MLVRDGIGRMNVHDSAEPAHRAAKRRLREQTRARRAALTPAEKERADVSVTAHLTTWLASVAGAAPALSSRPLAAAYAPLPTEPGGNHLLPGILRAGWDVLLPVIEGEGELKWAAYTPGSLVPGTRFGIAEPAGPRLPPAALADCQAIILPALGVDRHGVRLGQGAGYYDRALAATGRDAPRAALVYDEELYDALPAEPHDQPVDAAVTPSGIHLFR